MDAGSTRGSRRALAAWKLTVDGVTADVVAGLRDAGVPCLLLRGPAVAERLYTDGTWRSYSDCDLLVRRDQLDVADRVMRAHALQALTSERTLPLWQQHAHNWLVPSHRVGVEVHWTIMHARDPELLWERFTHDPRVLDVAGVPVPAPRDEVLAVILALHAAQHGHDSTRAHEDLRRAVAMFAPETWRAASGLADELGAAGAFAAGLRLIPTGVTLADELGLSVRHPFEVALTSGGRRSGAGDVERFLRAPSLRARVGVVLETLVPAPALMRHRRPIAGRGRAGLAIAYLLQPVHVVRRLAPGVRAWRELRRLSRSEEDPPPER